mgnify:CR=1 FL=1
MKKVIFVVIATVFLNGCFQVLALVAPAASGVATGNIYQSAISYSVSYGVKKTTGKTIIENVIDLSKDFKHKEQIAKNKANKDLISSFYPRVYPGTLKPTYIF